MAIVIPGRRQQRMAQSGNADRPYAVTEERIRCLAEMIYRPMRYTQRFTEELSFIPTGGQHWHRKLQIQLPESEEPDELSWWVVPLGPFARRRFSDIHVTNAAGEPVGLVTRKQHGITLTLATLAKHLYHLYEKDEGKDEGIDPDTAQDSYVSIFRRLYDFYTEISDRDARKDTARAITEEYAQFLNELGFGESALKAELTRFSEALVKAIDTTQYLCWIQARPGQIRNLHVTHTVRDPKHKLEEGSLTDLVKALWNGIVGLGRADHRGRYGSRLRVYKGKRRKHQGNWFRQYGLAPINYAFNIPTYRYTTSYYSTLEPPENTVITYLDWEHSNSRTDEELDSAFHSVHVYNVEQSSPKEKAEDLPNTIRAYFRCTPHHHKQILGAALLNIVVVWLLAAGLFPSRLGDPLQGLLIAAPSIVIAFIAQQQRHYYAHALRRSRGVLWWYLVIGVIFLVAVAFSESKEQVGSTGLDWWATAASWLLATTSVAIFFWYFPLGGSYERVVNSMMQRKWELWNPPPPKPRQLFSGAKIRPLRCFLDDMRQQRWINQNLQTQWQCYEAAYEQYSRLIWKAVVLAVIATLIVLRLTWDFPPKEVPPRLKAQIVSTQADSPETTIPLVAPPPPTHPAPAGSPLESTEP